MRKSSWWWAITAIIILILAIITTWISFIAVKTDNITEQEKAKKKEQQTATEKYAAARSPAPATVRIPGPCEGPWDVRELEIPKGGLPIYLCWGWTSWADGPVTITFPDGTVVRDAPGTRKTLINAREVTVIFRADPEGSSRRVYVKNRW